MAKQQVTPRQFMQLCALFTIGSSILVIPSTLTEHVKQDAWISIILGIGIDLLLIQLYVTVGNLNPNLTFIELTEKLLGRWLGSLVSIFFIINSLFAGFSAVLYYVGEFMTTYIMEETPIQAFIILFAILAMFGLRLGLTTLGRAAEILFPLFVLLFTMMAISISPLINFRQIQPILEVGLRPILWGAFQFVSYSGFPLVFLLMIYPSAISQVKQAPKSYFVGNIVGGFFILIITLLCVLVLGAGSVARQTYPSFVLAKQINIGGFFTRIEVFMATLWFFSLFFKLTFYFYAALTGLAQLLKLNDYRVLLIPLTMIGIVYSLVVYPNAAFESNWDAHIWPIYMSTLGLFVPLLLWGVASFRNRNQQQ